MPSIFTEPQEMSVSDIAKASAKDELIKELVSALAWFANYHFSIHEKQKVIDKQNSIIDLLAKAEALK